MVEYLDRVDIVLAATGATRPILTAPEIAAALKRRRYRPLFLVDLSVPRNIDPAVDELDNAYLFNVDDLTQVVERSREARDSASTAAEAFVDEETSRFAQRLADLRLNAAVGKLTRHADSMRELELQRTRAVLDRLDAADRARVEAMSRALVKRVLHRPLAAIRAAAREGDTARIETILESFRRGFSVDPTKARASASAGSIGGRRRRGPGSCAGDATSTTSTPRVRAAAAVVGPIATAGGQGAVAWAA